jgi:hypothetical protein
VTTPATADTDATDTDTDTADPGPVPAQRVGAALREISGRHPSRRTVWSVGLAAVAIGVFFVLCLITSYTARSDSDAANIALQGWDLWHHNKLLHGWVTADASFYTFETPLYAATEIVLGIGAATTHIVSALTYTIVAVAAAWLARGDSRGVRAAGRYAVVAVLFAVPMYNGDLTATLLEVPDHIGTGVFLLLGFLLYARGAGRRGTAWCLFALLVAGQIGDATVEYVAVPSIALVAAWRVVAARRIRIPETVLAVAALASIPCANTLRAAMRTWGAYATTPPMSKLAPLSQLPEHARSTWLSLLSLYGISTGPAQATVPWALSTLFGGAALLAMAYCIGRTLVSWPRADPADQLLSLAIVFNIGAYMFSTMVYMGGGGGYEFAAVVAMNAVLVARNLPLDRIGRPRAVVLVGSLAAVALLVTGAVKPVPPSAQKQLAMWLEAHGLTYGIADYWDSSLTTVDAGNTVRVRAVVNPQTGRFDEYGWATKLSWYDPRSHDANFFIADPEVPGMTVADVEKVYGQPESAYSVADREILVYRVNLLSTVYVAPPPDH